jgi:uncharacterized membrane protein YdjX (TVP38/TMEM64 family)
MTEPEQTDAARRFSRARLAVLAAIPLTAVAFLAAGVTDYVSLETLNAHRVELLSFVAEHRALATFAFAGVYFGGVALGIPAWGLLTVAGGFLFGPLLGSAIVVVSASAGGLVLFLVARYALADVLRAKTAPLLKKLEAGFNEDAFSYLLALRLVPMLPFFLTTLASAFLGVRIRTFIAATVLGIIPVTAVYATLGAGLSDALEASVHDPLAAAREPTVIGGLLGLAALALLPVAYKRLRRR